MNQLDQLDQPDRVARLSLFNSAKCSIVDESLLQNLQEYSWQLFPCGYCARVSDERRIIYLHRQVAETFYGPTLKRCVDHVNGNTLDNRIANLRQASQSENMCNRGMTKSNTSGYKGVYFHAQTGKWRAYVKKDYKQYYLGLYPTKEEAAIAYDHAAKLLHGDFAQLNLS